MFWNDAYPEVETMSMKIQKMINAGFAPLGSFILPDECWTENYYIPQRKAQEIFLERHAENDFAKDLVKNQRNEAEMYKRYKQFYGYAFYIGRKM